MPDPKETLERLIAEHGGVLVRDHKHKVFRFPNGITFVAPSTPEDIHAYGNSLSCLKNILGLHRQDRGKPGARREKRLKSKASRLNPLKALHGVDLEKWRPSLAAVKSKLPPRPVAQQRPMSSSKIIRHPIPNTTPKPRDVPFVPLDDLLQRFGRNEA